MMRARKTPIRTCVGCGETSDKRELVRVVRTSEGDVVVDGSGKRNGRGAYVHAHTACFDAAARRRRFDGALRVTLKEDDVSRLRREFNELLGTSVSSGKGR